MIEAATPCRSLFLSPLRSPSLNSSSDMLSSSFSTAQSPLAWRKFSKRIVRVFVSEHPAHFSRRDFHRGRQKYGRDPDLIHIYLVRQIDDLAYPHRAALHEAVKVERQTHILENEVTLLFKGDLIKALSKALSEMQERFSARPAHVSITTDAIHEYTKM